MYNTGDVNPLTTAYRLTVPEGAGKVKTIVMKRAADYTGSNTINLNDIIVFADKADCFATAKTIVSVGKSVTTNARSLDANMYGPGKINDGASSTFTVMGGTVSPSLKAWIKIDLSHYYDISEIMLYPRKDYHDETAASYLKNLKIYASEADVPIEQMDLIADTGAEGFPTTTTWSKQINADKKYRYVAIMKDEVGKFLYLAELTVYADIPGEDFGEWKLGDGSSNTFTPGKDVTISLPVTNNSFVDANYYMILAAYDEDELLTVNCVPVTTHAGAENHELSADLSIPADADYVKAFLWSGKSITPCTKSITFGK